MSDRRSGHERRRFQWSDIHGYASDPKKLRCPSWTEQVLQFATRYLFLLIGVIFFNFSGSITPVRTSLELVNWAFLAYFLVNTAFFLHAWFSLYSPFRFRAAPVVDLALASLCLLNDPFTLPPSLLVYIVVVLANGMRYGMKLFGEVLIISFVAVTAVFSARHLGGAQPVTPGLVFLNLFGGIILVYAYILMGRVESSRYQLEKSSHFDSLTGVMNRRALESRAERLFELLAEQGVTFVVMFADLDKFKAINDTHGHAMGDRVLKEIAAILRRAVRGTDLVARHGGDEFVLLLENISLDLAEAAAGRIRENVALFADETGLDCSVTIGLGEAPTHGGTLPELLERVDSALYHSKLCGTGGGVCRVDVVEQAV